MAKEQTTGFSERVLWTSLYGTIRQGGGGEAVHDHALHLHARGARAHQPRRRVPALDQEHQHADKCARGDRAKWTEEILKERGLKAPIGRGEGAAVAGAEGLMAAAIPVGSADDAVAALRASTPFGTPGALLARIAALGRPARYAAGERIYSAGDPADDIFVVLSGAHHVFARRSARASR